MAGGRDRQAVVARAREEAVRIGFDERFLTRALNVDLSGGEKKRNETLQLAVLEPKIAILDELDSGLDVDALRDVSRRVEEADDRDRPRRAGHHPLHPPPPRAEARRRPRPVRRPHRARRAVPSWPTSSR